MNGPYPDHYAPSDEPPFYKDPVFWGLITISALFIGIGSFIRSYW